MFKFKNAKEYEAYCLRSNLSLSIFRDIDDETALFTDKKEFTEFAKSEIKKGNDLIIKNDQLLVRHFCCDVMCQFGCTHKVIAIYINKKAMMEEAAKILETFLFPQEVNTKLDFPEANGGIVRKETYSDLFKTLKTFYN